MLIHKHGLLFVSLFPAGRSPAYSFIHFVFVKPIQATSLAG